MTIIIFSASSVFASDVIPSLENGMVLKCVAKRDNGTYYEYKNGHTDYYEYKNGKLYSQNLSKMFGNPNYKRKVLKLNISDNTITFKDRLYRWGASHYKWVTINRKTGKYSYDAKKQYNWAWYFQKAEGHGTCSIVE